MAKKSKKKRVSRAGKKAGGDFGKSSVGGFSKGMDSKMSKVKF
tara:strand:+ start:2052 stop:2180 length:129 start_codon:yes stop_codon:yes gene_type:complete